MTDAAVDAAADASATAPLEDSVPSLPRRWLQRVMEFRVGPVGLRTRILLMFTLGALLLAGFLAAAAYSFTRSSLITQRDKSGVAEATRNATVAESELVTNPASGGNAIDRLQSDVQHRIGLRIGKRLQRDPV